MFIEIGYFYIAHIQSQCSILSSEDVESGVAAIENGEKSKVNLADCYEKSHYNKTMREATESIYTQYRNDEEPSIVSINYPTSFFSQVSSSSSYFKKNPSFASTYCSYIRKRLVLI